MQRVVIRLDHPKYNISTYWDGNQFGPLEKAKIYPNCIEAHEEWISIRNTVNPSGFLCCEVLKD